MRLFKNEFKILIKSFLLIFHNLLIIERVLSTKEQKNLVKERQIDTMPAEAVLNELKDKRLPTYGTAQERKDRLKK
jgi:hypothetical protein